jgi:hypothetical protein
MGQWWERFYPLIISLLSVGLSITFKLKIDIPGFEKVLDGIITFTSIVIGFLGALLAIILSISKSKVMQHLYKHVNESNGKNLLYSYFNQTIIAGFVTVILSIFLYILKEIKDIKCYGEYALYIWVFFSVFFILSSYRIVSVLMRTLFTESKLSNQDAEKKPKKLPEDQVRTLKEDASKQ